MYRLTPTEKYRVQARVCAGMAQGAPSEEIQRYWLALAASYERAADALRPKRPSNTATDSGPRPWRS
jgi:hypothetical protein